MHIFTFLCALLLQPAPLTIISPDFENEGSIPSRFTCDGEDINTTIIVNGMPEGTKSLALIVEDPDAPLTTFTQWLVWNIPPGERIPENSIPGIQGINTVGKNPYRGPCPVAGAQRYSFKVYALNTILKLEQDADRSEVEKAMEGHILAMGELLGEYNRSVAVGEKNKK
ncbi:MAG TPA: YbhB/YbcL family Raf kinase inhibitor-like protein [Flavitalea sp.]|nr:YbhB/YbcL family Raf kinase inhibitor-like protein [Flavitalea sp.]